MFHSVANALVGIWLPSTKDRADWKIDSRHAKVLVGQSLLGEHHVADDTVYRFEHQSKAIGPRIREAVLG